MRKNPWTFLQKNPGKWFDPRFENGFVFTKKLYEEALKQRKMNKMYNSNLKDMIDWYCRYMKNQTEYHAAVQFLGKKRDKQLLDLFNKCVLDKDEFNKENIDKYRQIA
jgi:hypothetical protein